MITWIAIGMLATGILSVTIGALIDAATDPQGWEARNKHVFQHGGRMGVNPNNRKAAPWAIAGVVMALIGLGLLIYSR